VSSGVASKRVGFDRLSAWSMSARASVAVLSLCAIALGGCAAHRPATQVSAKHQGSKYQANAKYAKPPAKRMVTTRASIPLPDRALLQRQPAPECTFRGPVSSPPTAEETRQKLDYEQQCYRQSESNVRGRLHTLQDAVGETIKAVEQR